MVSDSPAQPAQLPKSDSPAPSSSRSASFISADLNVRLSGRIVGDGEAGRIEGLQVELDQGGITVKYPQLLSVQTKPESQTLSSINTGERLLTLPTPFITASSGSSDSNEYDDAFEDDSGSSTPKKTVVTLHEGFLPASETEQIEQSPLFSSTFKILVDSPSFPAPHFDPASLAPLTPSVKPLDPTSASSAAAYGGILNSPTLQRALLSPLLSPQRRAASQGSDLSVPPLSLGLSRTSRASFSGAGERPRVQGSARSSLVSLIPSLAPPASGPSTASSSSTDPPHSSSVPHGPSLATTLTHALSSSAKKTAEEILSLRRTHDAYQRRAKAELEILEQRIEIARQNGAGEGAEGVVRGFKTREEREKSVSASRSRERGEKDKKEEGKKAGSGSRSRTRGTSGERRGESTAHPKSAYMDEEMSSRIREQDEREEEERGRSRSRSRGGSGGNGRQASARGSSEQYTQSANAQRSRSRTKAVAEATAKAVEGAQQRGQSGSRERAGQSGGAATDERGRGRGPARGENLPATLEEEGEDEADRGRSSTSTRSASAPRDSTTDAQDNLLSPSSAAQAVRGPSSSGATPTFIPSSHALVAIPESEELSLPPSEAGDETEEGDGDSRKQDGEDKDEEESDPPFEMDEDVDVDVEELDIGSSRQPAPLESPSLEIANGDTPPPQSVAGQSRSRQPPSSTQPSSSFRPGSFQRASALSASYNALLASPSALAATKSPLSPPTVQPISPSVAAIRSYGSTTRSSSDFSPSRTAAALNSLDTLPPFSPPEAHAHLTSSARDDAENALAAATFEHATLSRGRRGAEGAGPDPREVRRGEQKIRDVLAMDVPSHRPRNSKREREGRVGLEAVKGRAALESDEEEEGDEEAVEDGDDERMTRSTAALGVTAPSGQIDPATNAFVGSLPIALGRPSTINAALSSWRPDPERLWAQQRRERKTSISSRGEAGWVPPLKTGFGAPMPTQGGRAAAVLPHQQQHQQASSSSSTQPLEIGSPSTPRPVAGGSSLAQSLRHASFSHRAALDERGTNGGASGEGVEDADGGEDEDDEDDGEFVPPHLVADRKGRRSDEAMLSRKQASSAQASHPASPDTLDTAHDVSPTTATATNDSNPLLAADVVQTSDKFAALRSHSPAAGPLEDEPRIEYPSVQKGDWRAYGRVMAQVVLWPEGTVGEKGVKAKKVREVLADKADEWVVEGTLWITKNKEILLVLDRNVPPFHIDFSTLRAAPTLSRRLSLSGLRRSISRTSTTSGGDAREDTEEDKENTGGGVRGFVKKIVEAVKPRRASSSEGGDGLALTRTRSSHKSQRSIKERRKSHDANAGVAKGEEERRGEREEGSAQGGQGGLAFAEPVIERREGPFPAYKGHSITALYISSPYLIRSIRFYAQHKPTSPPSLGLPISTPPDDAAAQDPSREPREDLGLVPPVVEVDVAQPEEGRKYEGVGEGEGLRMREVTVGFVFPDVLLADEATDFHTRIESLLRPSSPSGPAATTTTGSSLFRTLSRGASSPSAPPIPPVGEGDGGEIPSETGTIEMMAPTQSQPKQRRRGSSFLRGMPQGDVWV
ncbi:hypothetical protein JCM10049v2_005697 [Rhodotorula toruloides]